jgi:hypothetical protein
MIQNLAPVPRWLDGGTATWKELGVGRSQESGKDVCV